MLDFYHYILICFIIVFGLYATLLDLQTGKIKNKLVIFGFGVGMLINIIFIILSFVFTESIFFGLHYYVEFIINFLISIIVAYLFWSNNLWSAGDAKLFIVFVFLLPLYFYSKRFLPYFPAFALLFNIFVSALIYYLFMMALSLIKNFSYKDIISFKKKILKKTKKLVISKVLIKINVYVFLLIIMSQLVRYMSTTTLTLIFLLIMIYIRKYVKKISETKFGYLFFLPIMIFILFYRYNIFSLELTINFLPNYIKIYSIFFLIRTISDFYIEKNEVRKIDILALKPGMLLSAEEIKNFRDKEEIGNLYPDGLTEKQVDFIKYKYNHNGAQFVDIYKTIPFGLWISIGMLVTIICRQSIYYYFF